MDLKALWKIGYGMYIVCSRKENVFNGQIANTVFQVTAEPPTIAVSINKQNYTHECITTSGIFAVSILAEDTPMPLIALFGFKSGRNVNKFEGMTFNTGTLGLPRLTEHMAGYIEAKVTRSLDAGTHTVFIGEVVSTESLGSGRPMTYAYYHDQKKGTAPKTAPTYMGDQKPAPESDSRRTPEAKQEGTPMKKYKCTVCGYIYDPAAGDPDSGIKPGTPFEQIPDTWVCPVCGAAKDAFEPVA